MPRPLSGVKIAFRATYFQFAGAPHLGVTNAFPGREMTRLQPFHETHMRHILIAASLVLATAAIPLAVSVPAAAAEVVSQEGAVTIPALRSMVQDLGYEARDIEGEPESAGFEFTIVQDGLDIHILVEESESTNYVWFKVALGAPPESIDPYDYLRQTALVQPAHFYLYDSGQLGLAVPMDNRGVDVASIERAIDILVYGVTSTVDYWNGGEAAPAESPETLSP
jgi:hypothetical protein